MTRRGSVEREIMLQLDIAEEREEERKYIDRVLKGNVKVDTMNGEVVERPKPWWAFLRRSYPKSKWQKEREKRRGWW